MKRFLLAVYLLLSFLPCDAQDMGGSQIVQAAPDFRVENAARPVVHNQLQDAQEAYDSALAKLHKIDQELAGGTSQNTIEASDSNISKIEELSQQYAWQHISADDKAILTSKDFVSAYKRWNHPNTKYSAQNNWNQLYQQHRQALLAEFETQRSQKLQALQQERQVWVVKYNNAVAVLNSLKNSSATEEHQSDHSRYISTSNDASSNAGKTIVDTQTMINQMRAAGVPENKIRQVINGLKTKGQVTQ